MSRYDYADGGRSGSLAGPNQENEDSQVYGMYKMLNESGRLEQIRAQLRREIFTHLLDSNKSANAVDIDLLTSTPGRLSLALVAGFVRRHFPATFSVFMAEANLAWLPIDENEALLLNRLGVPAEQLSQQASALESSVQHLLRLKLEESSKREPAQSTLPRTNVASWQSCLAEKAQSFDVISKAPRSAESILSEMRTLIREELGRQPEEPKESEQREVKPVRKPPVEAEELPNRPNPNTSIGLDESRLHEYIEKMVDRIMGTRRPGSSSVAEKKDEAEKKGVEIDKKVEREVKTEKQIAKKKKDKRKVSTSQKRVSSRKTPSPSIPPKAKPKKAEAVSPRVHWEPVPSELVRAYPAEPKAAAFTSSDGLVEARQRLEELDREATKLESAYNQRLASLDTSAQRVISKLNSSTWRRSETSSSICAPRSAVSVSSTLPKPTMPHYRPSSATVGSLGTASAVAGLGSRPARFSVGLNLPASSRYADMRKKTMSLMSHDDDPYHSWEYDQSQSLLTSFIDPEYRWARQDRPSMSSSLPKPGPVAPQPLPFSVYPNGNASLREEIQQAMQQVLNHPQSPPPAVEDAPKPKHRSENVRFTTPQAQSPLVIDNKRVSRDIAEDAQLAKPSQTPEAHNLSNTSNFFSPTVLNPQEEPVAREPAQVQKPDASPEWNKVERYLDKPTEGTTAGLAVVVAEEPEAEEVSEVEEVAEAPGVEAKGEATGGGEVDDVLQRYMQMVLERRASSAAAKSDSAGRRDEDDDDDDGVRSGAGFRPVVSAGKSSREQEGDDDFWS